MSKYLVEWNDERTVFTEIEAKSEEDAIKQVLEGHGKEIDWSGSSNPSSRKQIESVKKGDD